jgi:hypothetical protein
MKINGKSEIIINSNSGHFLGKFATRERHYKEK